MVTYLVLPGHGGVEREEGAKDVSELLVVLSQRIVPDQEETLQEPRRVDGPRHEQLAESLGDFGANVHLAIVQESRQESHYRVASLGIQVGLGQALKVHRESASIVLKWNQYFPKHLLVVDLFHFQDGFNIRRFLFGSILAVRNERLKPVPKQQIVDSRKSGQANIQTVQMCDLSTKSLIKHEA